MGKRRVRLQDVAEKVGVSPATVSLVLNNKATRGNVRISDRTIHRVRRAAMEMGYLMRGTVGLIVRWISDSAEVPLIRGINEVFRAAHCNLAMGVESRHDHALELEEIRAMSSRGFESLIIQPTVELLGNPDLLRENFGNWENVVVLNQLAPTDYPSATVDQEMAGYVAGKHLADMGHEHILCLTGLLNRRFVALESRRRGFRHALEESGLAYREADGLERGVELPEEVTGVFCSRYQGAGDFLASCVDRKIAVPDRVSIVGVADDREKRLARPRITTVDMRPLEMGRRAAEMALTLMDGKSVENVVLEPKLVERESVRDRKS